MSTPPSWPLPEPERPNPFAPPAQPDGPAAGAPSPYGAGYAPPTGYDAAPTPPPSWSPEPIVEPAPGPATPPGYPQTAGYPQTGGYPQTPGYPPAAPYGSAQSGYPQTPGYPQPGPAAPAAPPYGSAPQGQGAYGYPQQPQVPSYGYAQAQGPYGYPQPQWGSPQAPWDGLAIASISTSGAGIVTMGLTGPVGIGLGIASLRKIRRTGARGRGLAWTGIGVGIAMTLFFVGFVALVAVGARSGWEEAQNSSSGSLAPLTDKPQESVAPLAFDERLWPGDCLEVLPSIDLLDPAFIDCEAPHAAEVLAYEDFTASPSSAAVAGAVQTDCADIASAFAGGAIAAEVAGTNVWAPSDVDWADGVHTGYCLLVSGPGGLMGSAYTGTLVGETPQVQS